MLRSVRGMENVMKQAAEAKQRHAACPKDELEQMLIDERVSYEKCPKCGSVNPMDFGHAIICRQCGEFYDVIEPGNSGA